MLASRWNRAVVALLLSGVTLAWAPGARGEAGTPTRTAGYSTTVLGPFGRTGTYTLAINARGDITGEGANASPFLMLAWTAFAVLIITGIDNVHNAGLDWLHLAATAPGRTLAVKLGFVGLSGLAAAVHAFVVAPRVPGRRAARLRMVSALLGVISLLAAAVAALYGVVIAAD